VLIQFSKCFLLILLDLGSGLGGALGEVGQTLDPTDVMGVLEFITTTRQFEVERVVLVARDLSVQDFVYNLNS
jgi:hypothetical protein